LEALLTTTAIFRPDGEMAAGPYEKYDSDERGTDPTGLNEAIEPVLPTLSIS
jgi:hypothetical protein